MPPAGFEPAIPTIRRPQTHALDRTASGISSQSVLWLLYRLNLREKNVRIQGREEKLFSSQRQLLLRLVWKFRTSKAKARSFSYAITLRLGLSLHTPRSRILLAEVLVRFIIIWAKYTLRYSKIHYGAAPVNTRFFAVSSPSALITKKNYR